MSNSEQVPEQGELPGMPEVDPYDALVEWLEAKWGRDAKCPYCSSNEWYVGPQFQFAHGKPLARQLYYAPEMFTVACRNCGHTVFVNREAADLESQRGDETTESPS